MTTKSVRKTEERGVYTLLVKVNSDKWIRVGRLGRLRFSGLYAYTGSALGRGGASLNMRVSRHLREEKKSRWHIDYLLGCPDAEVRSVVTSRTEIKSKECEVSQNVLASTSCIAPIRKFGSSDCSCRSHLIHLEGSLHEAIETILRAHRMSGLDAKLVSKREFPQNTVISNDG